MAFHSNIRGGQRGYLGLAVSSTAYAFIINTSFVRQVHPVNLVIPIAATRHTQQELKRECDKNLQVFHKTREVEWTLIQKIMFAVKARYITAMTKRTNDQFTGIQ